MIDLKQVELRPGQREVAEYRAGILGVPAVPGAGKTFTLAYLTAELIEKDFVAPGKILIVTYMNSAVCNFRSRIGNFLEQKGLPKNRGYEVKTLHSLAMSILKERPDYLLINQEFKMLDQNESQSLIAELTNQWIDNNIDLMRQLLAINKNRPVDNKIRKNFVEYNKRIIAQIKLKGLDIKQAQKLKEATDKIYLKLAFAVYINYSKRQNENAWLDFNDLITKGLTLLKEDEELCQRLQQKYSYIFEDEAQDSNPVQEEILNLLAGEDANLVRVGDSNQSILGSFTAADPQNFRDFCQSEDVQVEQMFYSSRSTTEIIDLANHLVKWSCKQHPQPECKSALQKQLIKPMTNGENPEVEGYTIGSHVFADFKQEKAQIAKNAYHHLEKNPDNTVAILLPTNRTKSQVADELKKIGAEYEEVGSIKSSHDYIIAKFKKIIDYLATPHKLTKFKTLIKDVFLINYPAAELNGVDKLCREFSVEELLYPIGGELALVDFPEELSANPELYTDFKQALKDIRLWLDASTEFAPDELVLFLAEQLELEEDDLALAQGIALEIRSILADYPQWRLSDVVEQLPEIESSFKGIAKQLKMVNGFEPTPGVISVLTIHKAKGLEWDTVFLPYLTSSSFPAKIDDWFRSDGNKHLPEDKRNLIAVGKAALKSLLAKGEVNNDYSPGKEAKIELISEKLRLLYVAITRAQKNLFLSSNNKGKLEPACYFNILSRFIEEEKNNHG